MKNIKRSVLASLVALGMLVGVGVLSASAYIEKSCYIFVSARGSASAWAVNSTTSRMHVDENGYTPGGAGYQVYPHHIEVDNVSLPGTQDQYLNVATYRAHSVEFWFRRSDNVLLLCTVSFASGVAR
jgi:hypothetical protein